MRLNIFTFGAHLFRQVIGIPMGSDPAPFFANLFLYHYDSQRVKSLKKTELSKAKRFHNTFRFIDHLLAINDEGVFKSVSKKFIPLNWNFKSSC